jgi:hypothetical protein
MSNIIFRDGNNAEKVRKASGTGTVADPYVPENNYTFVGTLPDTANADLVATRADLDNLAGTVDGTEVQVDVLTLPDLPDTTSGDLAAINGKLGAAVTNAAISISSSGDNTIITPTAGKALRITHLALAAASPVAVIAKLDSTSLTGAMSILSYVDSEKPYLWAGAANEIFKLNLGSAVAVAGFVLYYEV